MVLMMLELAATLAACAESPKTADANLLPLPGSEPDEPRDEVLQASIRKFLADTGAPAASLYERRRVDLNGDGRRDALVLFKNPYGYWCGLYGCTMLILMAGEENFKLLNATQPVRGPLFISAMETNGWKNIIVHVSGRWAETKDVALQFDGEKYPASPSDLPPYLRYASNRETRLFYD